MRLSGRTLSPPKPQRIVIPREEEDPIILFAGAILDYGPFNALCPRPVPPAIMKVGEPTRHDFNSPIYAQKLTAYSQRRTDWMLLTSLSATSGLEWDSVKLDDPKTWNNIHEELAKVFTESEIHLIIQGVTNANVPSEDRQQEALQRFAASQVARKVAENRTSPPDGPGSTPSGGLAKDLV